MISARNAIVLPRLVQSVQWYRVDDWGNTEIIDGATQQEYTVILLYILIHPVGKLVSFLHAAAVYCSDCEHQLPRLMT